MTGSGDVGGEVSGEEAAWRDLIARFDIAGERPAGSTPWPAREDLPDADGSRASLPDADQPSPRVIAADLPGAAGAAGTQPADDSSAADDSDGPVAGAGTYVPLDRTRIIRFAGDPRSYSPPDEEDERYRPAPLPPPAKMDPVTKGAWVALIGGPGYLLLGTILGWSISGTEALAAIAAFIAGFVILVLKMSDHPRRDDDDDGAVL